MPVAGSDIKFILSGGAANTDPNASIGGAISATAIVSNTLANLFDNVGSAEALAGDIEYRCMYVLNDHATDDADAVTIWIESQTPDADTAMAIGLDPAGVGDGTSTGVADTPADEDTAPSGVTFSAPSTEGTGLAIGALAAGECAAVWIRRTVTAGAPALANDPATFRVSGVPL